MKKELLERPKNIIVRMPNWLGDAVMATPVIQDLRAKFPEASITVMAIDKVAPIFQRDPDINELFFFSKPKGGIFLRRGEEKNIIDSIRRGNYDLGILLTNSFSSAWWFFRGRVKVKIGFTSDLRRFFLNIALPFPENRKKQHLVETYKAILAPLGIHESKSVPKLTIASEEVSMAKETLKRLGFFDGMVLIGMNTGAAFGPAKCWPEERFREVAKRLSEKENLFIVCFGDAKSYPQIQEMTEGLPSRVCNLAGLTSLRELMALISVCDLFLTNDSGPMHIAAALNVPLVAIFGSTDDVVTGPYKTGKVIHKHVECSPCFKRVCPIDFRCMKRITVDEVYEEVKKMIEGSRV